MPPNEQRYPADAVLRFLERVFVAAEVDESVAFATARGLWSASVRGVDSHGVRLAPHYVRAVQSGRINPRPQFQFEPTSPSTGRLDADHGFGIAAGMQAMRHAIELARQSGSGQVAVSRSSHCGAMAHFALEACREEMVGTAWTNATPRMRTPGATTPFFGANPICMAAPMAREKPFCFDGSTTTFSGNKIQVYRDRGLTLPPQCGADERGVETRVPADVALLLPIGDYKGFGLAMMVDILCGLLTGMPTGNEVTTMFGKDISSKRNLGHFFSAFRIDAFVEPAVFKERLREMADRIRSQPRQDADLPVQAPGDPEKAAELDRQAHGIPLGKNVLEEFAALAAELKFDPL